MIHPSGSTAAFARLAVISVTYHPDVSRLDAQRAAIPENALYLVVDNASDEDELAAIRDVANRHRRSCVVENSHNVGLAAAVNIGVQRARSIDPTCEFLLLLDQDSVPAPTAITTLIHALLTLENEGRKVGSVGPRLIDESTGLQHGFHCQKGWHLSRNFPSEYSAEPVLCINLNGSGTLVRTALFLQLGGLDPTFFIDHVDTDWAFRVLASGYELFGIPNAQFVHRMGDKGIRFWWFGWRVWPKRSPQRHYFLFRNAMRLLRKSYVPNVWKFWVLVKLSVTALLHGALDSQRGEQLRQMLNGACAGLFGSKMRLSKQ
jgi:rhamnosyltransferase